MHFYLSAKYYLSIFSSTTRVGIQDILRKNLHGNAELNLSSKATLGQTKVAVVERVKQQSMYGLSAKNIGRCGEVAVSGSSTVLAQLKCWQAAGHQATGSMFWREKPTADTASKAKPLISYPDLILLTKAEGDVTVIWILPRFRHPHIQNSGDMGIPFSYYLIDLGYG